MQGVILQSYGAGNAPDARKDLMAVLKDACDRGLIIINISQCQRGTVMVSYATGRVRNLFKQHCIHSCLISELIDLLIPFHFEVEVLS